MRQLPFLGANKNGQEKRPGRAKTFSILHESVIDVILSSVVGKARVEKKGFQFWFESCCVGMQSLLGARSKPPLGCQKLGEKRKKTKVIY